MEPNLEQDQPGQPLSPLAGPQPPQEVQQPQWQDNLPTSKPKKKSLILLSLAVIFVLAGGLFAWQLMSRDTDQQPANNAAVTTSSNKDLAMQYTLQLISKAKELKTDPQNAAALSKQLEEISQDRQEAMQALLKEDPATFLQLAEPTGFKDLLPEQALAHTEKAVEAVGKFEVRHGEKIIKTDDGQEHFEAYYEYYLDDAQGRSRVYFDKEVASSFYGKDVKLKGIKLDSNIAAQIDNLQLANGQKAESVLGAAVEKKVAVILFNFTANTAKPWTTDQVRSALFSATTSTDNYYRENSFNMVGLSGINNLEGDVFGWYTISNSITTCDPDIWAASARTALQNSGQSLTGYTNMIYAFPKVDACGWAGVAWMPGSTSWINGYATDARVVGHELGHNFGVHHATSLDCKSSTGTRVTLSDTCTVNEYGDMIDIMGFGFNHFSNFQKGRLGYYSSASNTVTAASGTNQYKVLPIETATTGLQSLRVPRDYDSTGKPINYYYVEARKIYGFDNFAAGAPAISGASVRIATDYSVLSKTELLDMTPGTTSVLDSALLAGKEFYDSKRNIRITTVSADSTGVVVNVTSTPPPCVRANPVVTISPVSQWASPGGSLSYTVNVTNKDYSSCSSSQFTIAGTMPANFTQNPASSTVTLAPGATATATFAVTASATIASGGYSFTETVTNSAATTYKTSVTGAFNVYDQTPVVRITQPANGSHIGSRTKISASASSQAGISKIELYLNGSLVKTVTGTTAIDYNFNTRKESVSTFSVTVRAYDTQNLAGSSSITLYK